MGSSGWAGRNIAKEKLSQQGGRRALRLELSDRSTTVHLNEIPTKHLYPRIRAPQARRQNPDKLWRAATKKWNPKSWQGGLGLNTPTLRVALKEAIAAVESNRPEEAEPGVLFAIMDSPSALLEYWCAIGRPELAVESLLEASRLCRGEFGEIFLHRAQAGAMFHADFVSLKSWGVLREALRHCSEEEYQRARDGTQEQRTHLDITRQCLVSFLFPREQNWSQETVEEFLKNPPTNRWGNWTPECAWLMLYSLQDDTLLKRLTDQFEHLPAWAPWPILEIAGERTLEILRPRLENHKLYNKEQLLPMLRALSLVETLEVAEFFASLLKEKLAKSVMMEVTSYFPRYPELALRSLPSVGKPAESLLALIVRGNPELARAVLPEVDTKGRSSVRSLLETTETTKPTAVGPEIPDLLAHPPWRKKNVSRKGTVVKSVESLCGDRRVDWRGRAVPRTYFYDRPPRQSDPARVEKDLAKLRSQLPTLNIFEIDRASDEAALQFLAEAPSKAWSVFQDDLLPLTARFGVEAVPGLMKLAKRRVDLAAEALSYIVAPQVAPIMAEVIGKKKAAKTAAFWFETYPEVALHGLIPNVVGSHGIARTQAESALQRFEKDQILRVASQYPEPVLKAVREFLSSDPLLRYPDLPSKLPEFAEPELLPPLETRSGKSLPEGAVREFLTMLCLTSREQPYAGISCLKPHLAESSCEEFCWELFQAWLRAGAKTQDAWCFESLAHYGGDETARRLTPLVRKWPGESAHQRAVLGLEVLGQIGTDVALMNLHGISQKLPFKALKQKAKEKIIEIARKRGLTTDELADRLVPDLGLEPSGHLLLDYGPRQFEVRFSEQLRPTVWNDGKLVKNLPKPAKSDDPEKASSAQKRWKALKRDVKQVAKGQVLRLERAMTLQRRWTYGDFRTFLVDAPLVFHLTRRLIWGVYQDEALICCFRVAEDRTLASVDDNEFHVDPICQVGIPHPLEMEPEELQAWQTVWEDYELLQPFSQLSRPVFGESSDEVRARSLQRFYGKERPFSKLLGLEERGWERGEVYDSGVVVHMEKRLPEGRIDLHMEPGLYLGDIRSSGDQTILEATFHRNREQDERLPLSRLSAISWSELMVDLEGLL
jgi:Domain of unknown function (DUF4132)